MAEAHIVPAREQFDAFKALPRDAPIAMLNQVRYRDRATYPGGHDCVALGLTGAEAYARYGAERGRSSAASELRRQFTKPQKPAHIGSRRAR